MALLEVTDLRTSFSTDDGVVGAVDGVSFSVDRGKVLGIVGESGCGKSVTKLSIMGLLPGKNVRISGSAMLDGRDLLTLSKPELRQVRGNDAAMIFQDPMTSLNPVHKIGAQLVEAVDLHKNVSRSRRPGAGRRDADRGRHPGAVRAHGQLPARAVGRHAPAGHDRDGADQQPAAS